MKKVLVLYYSQSGQLLNILDSLLSPLNTDDIELTYENIQMEQAYPFPWSLIGFLDVMPESVLEVPFPIKQPILDTNSTYDLIIFAYQPWFLSPSIPATSFLQSKYARMMKDTPVITVIGSRNMWLMAHEKVKVQLSKLGATLVMNIPFIDRAPNIASIFTIPAWMLSGSKKFFPFLPKAGVSDNDIQQAKKFGIIILEYLQSGSYKTAKSLHEQHPAEVIPRLISIERAGNRVFKLWARVIKSIGTQGSWLRTPFLLLFMVYLVTVISLLFPVTFLLYHMKRVLNPASLAKDIEYFSKGK